MHKTDLTQNQERDLNIFNLILECNDWVDLDDCELRLERGEQVSPEGRRLLCNGKAILEAQFHAPLNMITLQITDLQTFEKVRLHFMYDEQPERLLEWLAEGGLTLQLDNYPEWLKEVNGRCEMILLELAHDEIYEVKPPSPATVNKEG